MPIFCVKSVTIYTGQKKITRVYPWLPWQIWGMYTTFIELWRSTRGNKMGNVMMLTIFIYKAGTFIHFANCSLSISVSNIYNKRLYAFQYCQCLPATICADFKLMTTGTDLKTFNNPSWRMRTSTISCYSCKCGHCLCRVRHICN